MGRPIKEGENPVVEMLWTRQTRSRAGHEKSRLKNGGPSPKAKYDLVTDSEPVQ
jgi:hypothetical protein